MLVSSLAAVNALASLLASLFSVLHQTNHSGDLRAASPQCQAHHSSAKIALNGLAQTLTPLFLCLHAGPAASCKASPLSNQALFIDVR